MFSTISNLSNWLFPQQDSYVKELWIHPIKSLAGIQVEECEVDEHGFKHDRQYIVCQPDKKNPDDPKAYRFVTQRECPKLSLVEPSINKDKNELTLYYPPDELSLTVPLTLSDEVKKDAPRINVFIWDETPQSLDLSKAFPEISKFFDKVVGQENSGTTLAAPDIRRNVTKGTPKEKVARSNPTSSYQDYFPGNLINEKSLDDVRERVREKTNGEVIVQQRNFRSNMVIADTAKAWDEDDWRRVKIGEHTWYVACRNTRCTVTTVNYKTGEFQKTHEPLKTLQSFRRIDRGAKWQACFGMNMVNDDVGYTIKVGDPVRVLERGDHCYPS